ncbi:unnamed protein product [Discula destructiva]
MKATNITLLAVFGLADCQENTTPSPTNNTDEPLPPNGLALTPPMGWSSWNFFGTNINESLILATIDFFHTSGLQAAGYQYINLDDGWQKDPGNRSANPGPLEADPVKFPNGLAPLADYAHARGLKLGIYSGPGETTCAGYTGTLEGGEDSDAATFAAWGIDHLKYDMCCWRGIDAPVDVVKGDVRRMALGLRATGRDVVLHACHCGWAEIWTWARDEGANHWRIGQDISDDFAYPGFREDYYFDVLDMLDAGTNKSMSTAAGPGGWNDYDMLIVGLEGRSEQLVGAGASNVEYRAHFSMWCMVASPLLIGTDVTALSKYDLATLTNAEMIAINQDTAGVAATVVHEENNGTLQYWARTLNDSSVAVAFLNRGPETALMSLSLQEYLHVEWRSYMVRDLWAHETQGPLNELASSAEVIAHEAKVFKLTPVETFS